MWIATTFGTASTGTAISTLSGAAATNAALAWLGGGALAAGGGGTAAGSALLAMAGPIGWTIAGATLLSSILLFTSKRAKLNKQKNEEIESVKKNTEIVKELDEKIKAILEETGNVRNGLNCVYTDCLRFYDKDYTTLSDEEKMRLGALVNNTKTLSVLFGKTVS
jgi:membrane protein implicated in regulation of membrane protease activity